MYYLKWIVSDTALFWNKKCLNNSDLYVYVLRLATAQLEVQKLFVREQVIRNSSIMKCCGSKACNSHLFNQERRIFWVPEDSRHILLVLRIAPVCQLWRASPGIWKQMS